MAKRQQAMMDQMMGGMGGGGAAGQNPFADLMRQMQEMQNQQAVVNTVIQPLLMVKREK
jgi:UPF0716 protein FxsA